jgi:hypothetical protein
MTGTQNGLRITLIVEMVLGFFVACFLASFVGLMAMDPLSISTTDMILEGGIAFLVVFVPSVLLPFFSNKEIKT